MRAIDADELIKWIEDRYEITWEADTYEGGIKDACSDMLEKIDNMPTIEPQRKTGHWILHSEQEKNIFGVKTIECSECGDKCLVQFVEKEKYCRNCGSYNGGAE